MYRPDETKFPPHLVFGDYKLAIRVMVGQVVGAVIEWFGSIKKIEQLWT